MNGLQAEHAWPARRRADSDAHFAHMASHDWSGVRARGRILGLGCESIVRQFHSGTRVYLLGPGTTPSLLRNRRDCIFPRGCYLAGGEVGESAPLAGLAN